MHKTDNSSVHSGIGDKMSEFLGKTALEPDAEMEDVELHIDS